MSLRTKKLPSMGGSLNVGPKYIITKRIGAGSFGIVCEAIDTETQERVAIKQITRLFEEI
jgi:mitogen-activated protein kinase 1/3